MIRLYFIEKYTKYEHEQPFFIGEQSKLTGK